MCGPTTEVSIKAGHGPLESVHNGWDSTLDWQDAPHLPPMLPKILAATTVAIHVNKSQPLHPTSLFINSTLISEKCQKLLSYTVIDAS